VGYSVDCRRLDSDKFAQEDAAENPGKPPKNCKAALKTKSPCYSRATCAATIAETKIMRTLWGFFAT
jgi:hypothetical protein